MRRSLRPLALAALTAVLTAACSHYAAGDSVPQLAPTPGRGSPNLAVETSTSLGPGTPGAVCAPPIVADPLVVVERIRGAAACLSAARALTYRCAPESDPVITLGTDRAPDRYLGGRFALPVASLPEEATDLGVASIGRIWLVPGEERPAVVVQHGDAVERWLPLPPKASADPVPTAAVIGDSLMDGSREELAAALPGWDLAIDAEVGRSSSGAAAVAEAWPEPIPSIVVVEIAVNDHDPVAVASNLQRVVAAVGDPLLLLWLTGHGPDPDTDRVNQAIVDGVAGVEHGTVADWDALVPPDALDSGGVHLLPDRQGELADVIAERLVAWRAAVTGEGATGCAGGVRSAVRRTFPS
jgi:hypothetical protein